MVPQVPIVPLFVKSGALETGWTDGSVERSRPTHGCVAFGFTYMPIGSVPSMRMHHSARSFSAAAKAGLSGSQRTWVMP